jgi:hypothetical protein
VPFSSFVWPDSLGRGDLDDVVVHLETRLGGETGRVESVDQAATVLGVRRVLGTFGRGVGDAECGDRAEGVDVLVPGVLAASRAATAMDAANTAAGRRTDMTALLEPDGRAANWSIGGAAGSLNVAHLSGRRRVPVWVTS